jgi:hypothetical protein
MIDMHKLIVGQHVVLTEALPGLREGATGVVTEVTKWYVGVAIPARLDGVDGWYLVQFNYDGSVNKSFPWIDASTPGWDCRVTWGPMPGLKIIGIKEDS